MLSIIVLASCWLALIIMRVSRVWNSIVIARSGSYLMVLFGVIGRRRTLGHFVLTWRFYHQFVVAAFHDRRGRAGQNEY